jgi:hypothetical protein
MTTKIKPSNVWAIHDFSLLNQSHRITGNKLIALYRLIQKKGEPIQTEDEELKGVNVLEYDSGKYIGFIHTPIKKGSFFPCKLKTINLTTL